MIVVTDRNTKIDCPLADLSQQPSELFKVRGCRRPIFRPGRVRHLQVVTAYIMHELRVANMLGDFVIVRTGCDTNSSTREGHHLEVVLVQQIAQRFRTIGIVFQQVAT